MARYFNTIRKTRLVLFGSCAAAMRDYLGIYLVTTLSKSPAIHLIDESAPWVLISQAAKETGLTELLIRNSGVSLRKFGTAEYVRPQDLNAWINSDPIAPKGARIETINNGGKEETLP